MALNPVDQHKGAIVRPARGDANKYRSTDPMGLATSGAGAGLSLTGTVAHGQTVTITDSENRFGTRTNVKPWYVSLGSQKTGSTLGRNTGDYWGAAAELTAAQLNGQMSSVIRFDHKANSGALWDGPNFDGAKPFIQYIERYYDFDTTQAQYQNASGGFNLKTNRIWAGTDGATGGSNNIYIGYQGSEGGGCRIAVENVDDIVANREYYNAGEPPPFQWLSEEVVFEQSSLNTYDGYFAHRRNNTVLNSAQTAFMTKDSAQPNNIDAPFFDQVSNGCGSGVDFVYTYAGYVCIDDEYAGVYVCDTNDPATATKRVRLPQTAWAAGEIGVHLLETELPLSTSYLLFRTGKDAWVSGSLYLGNYV